MLALNSRSCCLNRGDCWSVPPGLPNAARPVFYGNFLWREQDGGESGFSFSILYISGFRFVFTEAQRPPSFLSS